MRTHIAAEPGNIYWRYEKPALVVSKMMLLTTGHVAVLGPWIGEYGEHYIAWSPMPKRDKVTERELGV